MEKWRGHVAIVTGASVGVGSAITKVLVEKGMKVVGIARKIDRIEELANSLAGPGRLYAAKCDVTREEEILKTFRWISENLGPVHVLINNACINYKSSNLTSGRSYEWRKVFDVNVIALCICTREAVKIMQANNIEGHVVHVNSISGHRIQPRDETNNVYPASKYAVTALTETLRQELASVGSRIKVSCISPGAVKTECQENANFTEDSEGHVETESFLRPEDVADSLVYILSTAPHVQVQDLIILPL